MNFDLVCRKLEQRLRQRFLRTLHIGLDDDWHEFDLARRHIGEHVLQLGGLLFRKLGVAELARAVGCDFAGAALISHHHELVTRLRNFSQTLDFNRN